MGIGSFVGQYLIGSQQRRQLRSEVLKHLAHTETARWAPEEPGNPKFRESMRELETAAMISRIPRKVVDQYKVFAYVAWWLSQESWDDHPFSETGGGLIESDFADIVRDVAAELSRSAWSPWAVKVNQNSRLKKNDLGVEAIDNTRVRQNMKRAQETVRSL
ncbi:hypothetical protein R4P64_32090 [Rhodococcus sp. IEGM 1366]|nr:hypothetical protein [Rhodococcus sp. IEGM 1366]